MGAIGRQMILTPCACGALFAGNQTHIRSFKARASLLEFGRSFIFGKQIETNKSALQVQDHKFSRHQLWRRN